MLLIGLILFGILFATICGLTGHTAYSQWLTDLFARAQTT
jgi:hypothetical protein